MSARPCAACPRSSPPTATCASVARVGFGWLSNDFDPDGLIGDPTAATAERGAELFAGSRQSFCEALGEIAAFDFGR